MWKEVSVLSKYLWKCKVCENVDRLGFTVKKDDERFGFCVYCGQGTQQVADVQN